MKGDRLLAVSAALGLAVLPLAAATVQAQTRSTPPIQNLRSLAVTIDTTGFRGTVVVYDVRRNHYRAVHPELATARRIPASTFKIANSLIALDVGVVRDEHTVIPWDSVIRGRDELNRDLDLVTAFRLSAVPHFQEIARRIGEDRMQQYLHRLHYGNENLGGGIDQFWLTGDLRICALEQIAFLRRLYQDSLPVSRRAMADVRDMMEMERTPSLILRGKTGWAQLPNHHEVGWWVGWVERGRDTFIFASMIEADSPGSSFGPARTGLAREVLRRLGIL
jgi:beta-lactamase class D